MASYLSDVIGSPSGNSLTENLGTIVCLAPKAANPLNNVTNRNSTIGGAPRDAFEKYNIRFHIPSIILTISG